MFLLLAVLLLTVGASHMVMVTAFRPVDMATARHAVKEVPADLALALTGFVCIASFIVKRWAKQR
jgi:hypothetical protein